MQGSYHVKILCNIGHMQTSNQARRIVQEDLAAAEAELAGWYETMQRETNALKRIYQIEGHDVLDSPSGVGLRARALLEKGSTALRLQDW